MCSGARGTERERGKGRLGMAGTETSVVLLSELQDGQEADCFAALQKKEKGTDRHGNPYVKCHFRDKRTVLIAPLWSSDPFRTHAEEWKVGEAYRLRARG